jgi:hypothetical protein
MITPEEVGEKCQPVTRYPYSSRKTDVWDILKESDADPDDSSKVRLIYTNYTVARYKSPRGPRRLHLLP